MRSLRTLAAGQAQLGFDYTDNVTMIIAKPIETYRIWWMYANVVIKAIVSQMPTHRMGESCTYTTRRTVGTGGGGETGIVGHVNRVYIRVCLGLFH